MRFFNRITLQTPESVELEFTLAGIGNRAWALVIDYFIWSLTLLMLLFVWLLFSMQLINWLNQWVSVDKIELWLTALFLLSYFSVYVGYFVFFETLWQGQTPGKRLAKIRVIRDDGRTVGLTQATLRALLRPLDDFIFIGAFLILLTHREKRLGDMLAGTIVIQEEKAAPAPIFTISERGKSLGEELIEISQISALVPDDFAIIREYLQRRNGLKSEAKYQVSMQLANQVLNIIALESIPEGVSADLFLEAVYFAYKHQSSY